PAVWNGAESDFLNVKYGVRSSTLSWLRTSHPALALETSKIAANSRRFLPMG
ncbi:Uncharacterized protein FKW44_020464, partial [Caligus rogercresseyi]